MKRPLQMIALATIAALLLSACTIVVEPSPRQPDATVTAANDAMTTVRDFNIAAGSDVLVRVNVNTDRPLLYLELTGNLEMEVFNANRTRIASSRSPSFFGAGTDGLSATALEPQAITIALDCDGSCVILNRSSSSHYFVLIRNTASSSRDVGLYAFGDFPTDEFEGDNESPTNTLATYNVAGAPENGAIETLGDRDWWRVVGNGTVFFDAPNPALGLHAYVYSPSGDTLLEGPISSGRSFDVLNNELILIRSDNNRAAPSASSTYYLSSP